MVPNISNLGPQDLSAGSVCRLAFSFQERDFLSVDSLYLGQPNDHPLLLQYPHFFVSRLHFDLGLSEPDKAQSVYVFRLHDYTIPGLIDHVPTVFPVSHGGVLFRSDFYTPYHDEEAHLRFGPKTQRIELLRRLQEAGL